MDLYGNTMVRTLSAIFGSNLLTRFERFSAVCWTRLAHHSFDINGRGSDSVQAKVNLSVV